MYTDECNGVRGGGGGVGISDMLCGACGGDGQGKSSVDECDCTDMA
jgi:hypothetical protein